jgi:hypothetical protein
MMTRLVTDCWSGAGFTHACNRIAGAALLLFAWPSLRYANAATIEDSPIGALRPEHLLAFVFCVLGCLIITFEFVLFLRSQDRVSASDITRGFSVILILIGVVALLGIGYDEKQIQPAIALFGTLLGYLLGRGERRDPPGGTPPAERSPTQRSPGD